MIKVITNDTITMMNDLSEVTVSALNVAIDGALVGSEYWTDAESNSVWVGAADVIGYCNGDIVGGADGKIVGVADVMDIVMVM